MCERVFFQQGNLALTSGNSVFYRVTVKTSLFKVLAIEKTEPFSEADLTERGMFPMQLSMARCTIHLSIQSAEKCASLKVLNFCSAQFKIITSLVLFYFRQKN